MLTELLILLVFVWFTRKLFQAIHFPPLFGEIFAGLLAGPAILGIVGESEAIAAFAELGVFFLMFHAGMEANPKDLIRSFPKAIWIAIGGMILPSIFGYAISQWWGYDVQTSVFVGLSLSITAVLISARLFKDLKLSRTQVAHVSLSAALIVEVFILVFFSVFLDFTHMGTLDMAHIISLVTKFVAYFFLVFFIGEVFFKKLYKVLYKGNKGFTFSIILALSFAVAAELIGLHMIIGAFFAGLFLRKDLMDPDVFEKIEDRVFGMSYSLLGPIFFATLAFHLDFSAFSELSLFMLIIFVIGFLGKGFGASFAASRVGMGPCESLAVGLSMNSRGALDLIVASIALENGIIDETLFSALVIIAFASTLLSILVLKPLAPSLKDHTCQMTFADRMREFLR